MKKNTQLHLRGWMTSSVLTTFFWLGSTTSAQSLPAQNNRPVQENDITRQELANFDQFLDGHRDIAERVRKDPSLVNNQDYLEDHPALQNYLQDHPRVREEVQENPNAFMKQEARFDRREENPNRDRDIERDHRELANFDQFLDKHHEIAEQLRKDPSRVDNSEFVKNHPALEAYLQDHPGVREEIKQNPNAFMKQEASFDRRENNLNRDHDAERDRREVEFKIKKDHMVLKVADGDQKTLTYQVVAMKPTNADQNAQNTSAKPDKP